MENLKEWRTKHNLSQMAMAVKLGVSYNCYILWERGLNKPNEENQKKIDSLLHKEEK